MTEQNELEQLIEKSFTFQKMIFTGLGIVTGLTGVAILLLSMFIPPKPGEENIVLGLQVTSVIFVVFAVWFPYFINNRLKQVKNLIFKTPEQIAEVKAFTVSKNGIPGFAVRIISKNKKMIGFNVTGPKTQARIVDLIKKAL